MGLDTSHDCWHGPYSSFNDWRRQVASAAGFDFDGLDDSKYEWCNFLGMWRNEPADPIEVLLVHSDCDGYLFQHVAERIADRLEELLPALRGLDDFFAGPRTERFIAGLRRAVDEDEVVVFG